MINDLSVDRYYKWTHLISGKIGYCQQENNFDETAKVSEQLKLFASIGGVKWDHIDEQVEKYLQLFLLSEYRDTKCEILSFGNARKLMIAMAFIGNNDLVLLDDPLAGIDPLASKQIQTAIKKISSDCAVIITSQNPEVAQSLSTRSAILHKGTIVRLGNLDDIIEMSGGAGIFLSCFYDMKRLHSIDKEYFTETNTLLSTHDQVIKVLNDLTSALFMGDYEPQLDFELEYDYDGALKEIYNLIESGNLQSRNYIVDRVLTIDLTAIVMEELNDSIGVTKLIKQYPNHCEMRIPSSVNVSYGNLYSLF